MLHFTDFTGYVLFIITSFLAGVESTDQCLLNSKVLSCFTGVIMSIRFFLFTWLNACSSGICIATGISSVSTFATFVRLPVSMALGAASMTGVIASGIISMLTKKYQKKLKKVTHLIDIVTPALLVFERVISGALKNGVINEEEFTLFRHYTLKH